MTQALVIIGLFILVFLSIPACIKLIRKRLKPLDVRSSEALQMVAAIAVGPHQRVITLEVGPVGARTWLTVGVTAQSVNFLHSAPVSSIADIAGPISKINASINVFEHG